MPLPPEDVIIALEENAQKAYEQQLKIFAHNNLVHIAVVAREQYPPARYVGLTESDQDMSGNQWVTGVWDADGNVLANDGDDFEHVPMNIWDRNAGAWHPYCVPHPLPDFIGDEPRAEALLDLDKIIEAYPTWQSSDEPDADGTWTPMMGWQDCRYVYEGNDPEDGDYYRCLTHGSLTLGHEVSCEKAAERYQAEFHPQVWVGDNALGVDPQGEAQWDATAAFHALDDDYRATLLTEMKENGDGRALDVSDRLQSDPNAPEWVREWNGPFSLWVWRGDGR